MILSQEECRVVDLVRDAFQGVKLGNGVGLQQGQGLDDYADAKTLSVYRDRDEKEDWSKISVEDLDRCNSSLSFFDAEGMRFHLPAFLIADINRTLKTELIFYLTAGACYGLSQFEMLSNSQRHAVREYLSLVCMSDRSDEFNRPMIEDALSGFWAQPAN